MEITEAKIKAWKKKYGENKIFQVEVATDEKDDVAIGYVKKPDLQTISAAQQFVESDPIKAGNIMFENCWLGGDNRIVEDDELKLGAIEKIGTLFKKRVATIKKL